MDTVQIEKLLAMKRYAKKQLLISSLIQYCLQASVLGLFLSSPSWLPKLYYCTAKLLLSVTMGPKCLFILSNIIIIFLVGESKISRPSPERDAYEECAARSPGIRGGVESVAVDDQREESVVEDHPVEECRERDIVQVVEEERVVVVDEEREKGGVGEEEEEEERESEEAMVDGEEEEERGLPAEELKRRVEDFIAKVNMQRRLEATMIIPYE